MDLENCNIPYLKAVMAMASLYLRGRLMVCLNYLPAAWLTTSLSQLNERSRAKNGPTEASLCAVTVYRRLYLSNLIIFMVNIVFLLSNRTNEWVCAYCLQCISITFHPLLLFIVQRKDKSLLYSISFHNTMYSRRFVVETLPSIYL